MRKSLLFCLFLFMSSLVWSAEPQPLAIGSPAPDFKLLGVDGRMYSLGDFSGAKVLVIVFTCNHCPTAQAYEQRIIDLSNEYISKGVQLVAISPNDPHAVRLDELGYSDIGDSYEEMRLRAEEKNYPFPYLYDGKTQETSVEYGPVATPHVFVFDQSRKLRFQGRIDNMENPSKKPSQTDTRDAINALLAGQEVTTETTKVFGCSVKWASKNNLVEDFKKKWAEEEVGLKKIDVAGVKDLAANPSGEKLRLINVWATWCGPCVTEFPDLITINRMYRGRDFELITLSADVPEQEAKALKFLERQQASTNNYLFSLDDKYQLIEALDPEWGGALPYTILVEPGGKIVYRKQGPFDASELKKAIVDHPMIGRVYNN